MGIFKIVDGAVVNRIIDSAMARKFDISINSRGAYYLESTFKLKYHNLINLEDFYQEILIDFAMTLKETKIKKRMMKEVLQQTETNEEDRRRFTKDKNRMKENHEKKHLSKIPDKVLEEKEIFEEGSTVTDNIFKKILNSAESRIGGDV